MKALLVILVILLFGVGCASPEPVAQSNIPKQGCKDLQAQYDTLQFNYDSLKRASDESKDWHNEYNVLAGEITAIRIENLILANQVQSVTAQFNAAINAQLGQQASATGLLEEMNRQLVAEQERNREINTQVQLLISRQVSLLSANLTATEYEACYKGVDLWWGTFNEKE